MKILSLFLILVVGLFVHAEPEKEGGFDLTVEIPELKTLMPKDSSTTFRALSFHFGVAAPLVEKLSFGTPRDSAMDSFTVTKATDELSPKLIEWIISGKKFSTITIKMASRPNNKIKYTMTYEYINASLGSFHIGGSSEGYGGTSTEEVSIKSSTMVKITYDGPNGIIKSEIKLKK